MLVFSSGEAGQQIFAMASKKVSKFGIEKVKKDLEEKGVAVVEDVLSQDDCDTYITQIRQWLGTFGTGFPENMSSIIRKYRFGHSETAWSVRLKAKPVFAELWGTEKLLTSMDGAAIGRPPEQGTGGFEQPEKLGLHYDQGPQKIGLHSYQGAVYLEEALEDDWCFMVIEKSHNYHDEFFREHRNSLRNEFRPLTAIEITWFHAQGCEVQRIACPKGGMILWDSRTVHSGALPKKNRSNPGRWRYVTFVCMAPAWWAEEKDLEQKRKAYNEMRLTYHWPAGGTTLFPSRKAFPQDIKELPDVAKTDEARRLAGFIEYDFEDGKSNGPDWKPKFRN